MEPLLLACERCRARIRTTDPANARARACPRCSAPLASAVDRASKACRAALDEPPAPYLPDVDAWDDLPRLRPRGLATVAWALLATVVSMASLALRESPDPRVNAASSPAVVPSVVPVAPASPTPVVAVSGVGEESDPISAEETEGIASLSPGPRPPELAIRESDSVGDVSIPPRRPSGDPPPAPPRPAEPPAPRAEAAPANQAPPPPEAGPRRVLVRDDKGKAIVAREHGSLKERTAVILPDGQIGWPEGLFFTDRPFEPATMDELRATLQAGEYADYRVIQTAHYLVFYRGTEPFARASADLLERLYTGLTDTLRRFKLPVVPAEFPLVAVIHRSEEDFRADRKVAPDVQACYEILSNRIFFYEKSRRDQESPEVSALRKPQTVAHEGTHQILGNVGIQPRLSDWPLWLVEGLAEYCSPPKSTRKGVDWAGLGQINPIHMATIRDLDDPMASQVKGGPRINRVGRDPKTPLVEYLATRAELTPTDYALSWGLAHYLANQRADDFVAYLKRMSRLKPFEARSPEDQLADFRSAFGADLAKLDARVGKYLAKIKVPDSLALPYYAVMFEQPLGGGAIRRMAMVSQSPSMIRQWLDSAPDPGGGPGQWQAVPGPTHARAVLAAEQWIRGH